MIEPAAPFGVELIDVAPSGPEPPLRVALPTSLALVGTDVR